MLRLILLTALILSLSIDDIRCDPIGNNNDEQFNCTDGTSIEYIDLCNGKKDCNDGSDEFLYNDITKSYCGNQSCPNNYVKCNYGACIPITLLCNGVKDCADGSDEWNYNCTDHPEYPDEWKACESGNFIEANKFCDGKIDCLTAKGKEENIDNSDERPFQCLLKSCSPHKNFRCDYGGCIKKSKICNHFKDCIDGSDEKDCEYEDAKDTPRAQKEGCEIKANQNYNIRNQNQNSNVYTGAVDRVSVDTRISIRCKNNYVFSNGLSQQYRICTKNGWDHPLPKCIKYCDERILYISKSTKVECIHSHQTVDCKNIVPGTIARVSCADGYQMPDTISDSEQYAMTCTSEAKWDKHKINCDPVCGHQVSSSIPSASDAPWHVGVKTYINQTCGGTIVSPKSVITALHCVQDEDIMTLNETDVTVVIAGDLKNGNIHIFTVNVSEIIDGGDIDVALLKLSEILTLSMNTRPICFTNAEAITKSNRAFLHSWTKNENKFGDVFNKTELQVLPNADCSANLNQTYMCVRRKYKLHTNGTLCEGDSGAGIIVENDGVNYIIGILIHKPSRNAGCTNEPVVGTVFNQIPEKLYKSIQDDKESKYIYILK
ncbi:modular serine protease-like isoform X1 [Zeugodacus cucurbitae]|uniref:modular serine protease-like isoform X1 n=1 Tax=Zeugodacus cucurbitae TaxID=28588 RepID=UPI0023D95E0F|nr:modular serine protease-like isoform X1 [Zeugodacus cucurbitae]